MILELRIGGGGKGAQTVFPGSVHETGELIAWAEKENIARADGDDIKHRCERAASAALLAANFPSKGARHDAIGKDTMLEPIKYAVGPWNFAEVSQRR